MHFWPATGRVNAEAGVDARFVERLIADELEILEAVVSQDGAANEHIESCAAVAIGAALERLAEQWDVAQEWDLRCGLRIVDEFQPPHSHGVAVRDCDYAGEVVLLTG